MDQKLTTSASKPYIMILAWGRKEQFRPAGRSPLYRPCGLSAREAVYEYYAEVSGQI